MFKLKLANIKEESLRENCTAGFSQSMAAFLLPKILLIYSLFFIPKSFAQNHMTFLFSGHEKIVIPFLKELSDRTSINIDPEGVNYNQINDEIFNEPWLWVNNPEKINQLSEKEQEQIASWVKRGGFLVLQNVKKSQSLNFTKKYLENKSESQGWSAIPLDHELMRSFFVLENLPHCGEKKWEGFSYDHRLSILSIPFNLTESSPTVSAAMADCEKTMSQESLSMLFINIVMVAFTTDYKKDHIHLQKKLEKLD